MKLERPDVLDLFRRAEWCEWCGEATPGGCDPAHVYSRGAGQVDIRLNVVSLCRTCHSKEHNGNITKAELLAVVARREGVKVETIGKVVQAIRRWPKEKPLPRRLQKYVDPAPVEVLTIGPAHYVKIAGNWYVVLRLATDPNVANVAFRVRKPDKTEYTVHRDRHGLHCTCPDGTYRRENTPHLCKHAAALVKAQLLEVA